MDKKNIFIFNFSNLLLETALELNKSDYRIIIHSREDIKKNIEDFDKYGFFRVEDKFNFDREDEVQIAMLEITKTFGNIDILILNSVEPPKNAFMEQDTSEWMRSFYGVINPVFLLSREVVGNMMKRKYGRIISISSYKGHFGSENDTVLSSALSGISTFIKSIAKEFARHKITANMIHYGVIDDKRDGIYDLTFNQLKPVREPCSGSDIVNAVQFLISERSSYYNGKSIFLDGGAL